MVVVVVPVTVLLKSIISVWVSASVTGISLPLAFAAERRAAVPLLLDSWWVFGAQHHSNINISCPHGPNSKLAATVCSGWMMGWMDRQTDRQPDAWQFHRLIFRTGLLQQAPRPLKHVCQSTYYVSSVNKCNGRQTAIPCVWTFRSGFVGPTIWTPP